MVTEERHFPVESWLRDMQAAVDHITQMGRSILETHRRASDKAEEGARRWRLDERLAVERDALLRLLDRVRQIIESLNACWHAMYAEPGDEDRRVQAVKRCGDVIEGQLPEIETSFVTIRQAALDLLQWTQRAGRIDDSSLPGKYRAAYADLIAYAPIFKPRIACFQEDLLEQNAEPNLRPDVQRLITLVNRYNAVMDSARGFVGSVVKPPLELVFHETQAFLEDFQSLPSDQMTALATEVNDCCQLLLYDEPEFRRRVETVRPRLADGIDSSMVMLTVSNGFKAIFTVDEDPVFEQLVVTLLRILPEQQIAAAQDDLTRALYEHFSAE